MKKCLLSALIALFATFNAQAQDCPRIYTKGDTLYTDPAPQYQWYNENLAIPSATKQWYVPPKKGFFSVRINAQTVEYTYDPKVWTKSITGRIIDERYEPVAYATVSVVTKIGTVLDRSDAQGRFSLAGLDTTMTTAVVSISKEGFWFNTQRVHFFDQRVAPLTAMLEPLRITNRFDAQKGATISERGFFLTFPPNSAVTESGATYEGTVSLSLKRSFPNEDGFGLRMPGGDFSAIDANGQEKMLVSYGFMSAEMQGERGEKLKLASDKEATLEFYITWEENMTAPDSMPLWHFDEKNGVWKPEGIARKVGPRYVGTVKHFSSWNCDFPRNRATCRGKVRNCKGNTVPYITINVGQRVVTANSGGEYTAFVPSDTEFDVTASVDTVGVTPLKENEERNIQNLKGTAIGHTIGILDTTGILSVWGTGLERYSVDGGKTFHRKEEKLTFTNDYSMEGIARDQAGCETNFRIYRLAKRGDCQKLDSAGLAEKRIYGSIEEALATNETVYGLVFVDAPDPDLDMLNVYFPCLHHLRMSNFTLSGVVPENIGQLMNLQELDLHSNGITSLPESMGQLSNLQMLRLEGNRLSLLPESIGQLTNLQKLVINDNQLTTLPEGIGQLKNLQTLYCTQNQLSSLSETIGQLKNLKALDFWKNRLVSLPDSIGQLINLQMLYCADNQLTSLPEGIGQLANLQALHLSNNQVVSLPETIGQLTNLQMLNLKFNKLTSLPETIGQLTNLQVLNLSNNQVVSLPETIGQLTSLQEIDLSYNQLTRLPASIADLKDNLKVLNLGVNPISEEEQAKIRAWLPNTRIY